MVLLLELTMFELWSSMSRKMATQKMGVFGDNLERPFYENYIFLPIIGTFVFLMVVKWNLISPSLIYTYKNIREVISDGGH